MPEGSVASPMPLKQERMDSRDLAAEIIKDQERKASKRGNWEKHWQDLVDYVMPNYGDFTSKKADGQSRTEKIFDSTAPLALPRFAAAYQSMTFPDNQVWQVTRTGDEELDADPEIARWSEHATKVCMKWRYSPRAGFKTISNEHFMALGGLGTGCTFSEEARGDGMRYRSIPLSEIYADQNAQGRIDNMHRCFAFSARQAAQKWGVDNLPDQVRSKLDSEPDAESEYIHCVKPRTDYKIWRRDKLNLPFQSVWVSKDYRQTIGLGGYHTFPYAISRYVTHPREIYGRSPAFLVLADIKMLNEMSRDMIRIYNRMADPPLLAYDDGIIEKISTKPGAVNYGGVDEQGRQLVRPMEFGNQPAAGEKEMGNRRAGVNTAFLVTLFQILIEHPRMSATEVLARMSEKGTLLAPEVGRQQAEYADVLVMRDIKSLLRAGAIEPMPRKLLDRGGELLIRYDTPLTRALRAEHAVGFLRTMEIVTPLAQVRPEIMDNFNVDEASRGIADINAVPMTWMHSKDEVDAQRGQRAQAEQAKQLLAAAPVVATAIERTSQAQLNAVQARA